MPWIQQPPEARRPPVNGGVPYSRSWKTCQQLRCLSLENHSTCREGKIQFRPVAVTSPCGSARRGWARVMVVASCVGPASGPAERSSMPDRIRFIFALDCAPHACSARRVMPAPNVPRLTPRDSRGLLSHPLQLRQNNHLKPSCAGRPSSGPSPAAAWCPDLGFRRPVPREERGTIETRSKRQRTSSV